MTVLSDYFNNLLSPDSSSTFICWMAIWLSFIPASWKRGSNPTPLNWESSGTGSVDSIRKLWLGGTLAFILDNNVQDIAAMNLFFACGIQ